LLLKPLIICYLFICCYNYCSITHVFTISPFYPAVSGVLRMLFLYKALLFLYCCAQVRLLVLLYLCLLHKIFLANRCLRLCGKIFSSVIPVSSFNAFISRHMLLRSTAFPFDVINTVPFLILFSLM